MTLPFSVRMPRDLIAAAARCRAAFRLRTPPGKRIFVQHADRDVLADGHVEEEAQRLAILGQIDDARLDRLQGRLDLAFLAIDQHAATGSSDRRHR